MTDERWSLQFSNTPPSVTIWSAKPGHEPRNNQIAYVEFADREAKVAAGDTFHRIVAMHNLLLDERVLSTAGIDAVIEARIDTLGWPEIHAFNAERRKGQDIYEDAGGFMLRAIKALFRIKPRDPVLTYRDAARAFVAGAAANG